jgi:novobiocin biosynthesis protein NovU/D-mycarose 3-C-methyltransferase
MPPVDVVVARHVFCHVDDWRGFMRSLDLLCGKETLVAIEVPHCSDLLKHTEFDTIYHEHLSYFTLRAMNALLEHTPFRLHRVQHFPIHGGAMVVLLRRRDSEKPIHPSVYEAMDQELVSLGDWTTFQVKALQKITQLRDEVLDLLECGKRVAGFGASAKSTVWINACGFTRRELAFVCDSTKQKWGCTSPGTDIPIVDEGALLREQPDYAIMFCWNFASEVIERNQLYLSKGGKFIVPVPSIKVISADGETEI